MADKQFDFNGKARLKLLRGAGQLTDAVKVTLGPRGRYVVLDRAANPPTTTKDGVSVAREFELENPVENMGAQVIKEIASKTEAATGDGTTTATIIAHRVLKESVRLVATGWDPMELTRGIDQATTKAVDRLKTLARPCRTKEMIAQVATFAANGDRTLGNLVAEALEHSPEQSPITIEQGSGIEDAVRSTRGMRFDGGYLSPHFVSDASSTAVDLEKPAVLLYAGVLASAHQLTDLLERVTSLDRPLLVVAHSVEGEALETLVVNHMRGVLRSVAVKIIGVGDQRHALLQDIAALTGATVISSETGVDLKATETSHLGSVHKATVTHEATTLIKDKDQSQTLDTHISHLRHQVDNLSSEKEKQLLNRRLANLTGGLTVIEVGGSTELEIRDKASRLEDALNASRAAIEEGVVPGGGAGLLACRDAVISAMNHNDAQTAGMRIVARALEEPLRQIAANAGLAPSVTVNEVANAGLGYGLDANSGEFGNLLAKGIVDPVKVVRNALQNATSAAGLLVTAECVITEVPSQPTGEKHR